MTTKEARLAAEEIWLDLQGRMGFDIQLNEKTEREILNDWVSIIMRQKEEKHDSERSLASR